MTVTDNSTREFACPLLMGAMIVALDIDLDRLGHPWNSILAQHAASRCSACISKSACRRWLGGAQGEPTEYQDFCPNAGLFSRLKGPPVLAD